MCYGKATVWKIHADLDGKRSASGSEAEAIQWRCGVNTGKWTRDMENGPENSSFTEGLEC